MNVLYFAWVRERVGLGHERVDPPAQVTTVAALIEWLALRGDGYAAALGNSTRLRAAIDQKFVPLDAPLGSAAEVAIFPPVTGG